VVKKIGRVKTGDKKKERGTTGRPLPYYPG
jgi:hypothetical protein